MCLQWLQTITISLPGDDDKLQLIIIDDIHQWGHEWDQGVSRVRSGTCYGRRSLDRLCDVWISNILLVIEQFTGYQTFYWISNSLLGIKLFTGYQTVYWVSNSLLGIKQFTRYQTVYWISISLLNIKISIGLKSLNFFNILCPCDILIRNFIGPPGMLIGDFIVSYTSWFWILQEFDRFIPK